MVSRIGAVQGDTGSGWMGGQKVVPCAALEALQEDHFDVHHDLGMGGAPWRRG